MLLALPDVLCLGLHHCVGRQLLSEKLEVLKLCLWTWLIFVSVMSGQRASCVPFGRVRLFVLS
jgi:hypothetical protein